MLFFLVVTQGNFIHAQPDELDGIKIDEIGNIGVGTVTPHESAKLHVKSYTKGVLIPRMSWDQMQAITPKVEGLMVYRNEKDSDINGPYYWDSYEEEWKRMDANSVKWGDIIDMPADIADGDDVGGDAGFFGSDGNKLYPLNNKHVLAGGFGGNTTSSEDWNLIKSNGVYDKLVISNGSNNGPPESNKYFHVQNWEYGTKDGNGNITQLAIPYGYQTSDFNGGMWLRGYSIAGGGTWSNWKQVSNDPYGINTNFGSSSTKLMASNQAPYYGYAAEIKDSYVGGFARVLGGIIAENPTHVSDYLGSYGFHGGGGSETEPGYISKFFVDVSGNHWNTTDFQVTETGVGIGGTSIPSAKLDIVGETTNKILKLSKYNSSEDKVVDLHYNGSGIGFNQYGTYGQALDIHLDYNNLSSFDMFNIKNSNGDLFSIINNGNIGIGTNTPSAKLDVVGNVEINGTLEVSDRTGIATQGAAYNVNGQLVETDLITSNNQLTNDAGYITLAQAPTTVINQGNGIIVTGGNGNPYVISAEGANANLNVDNNNGFDAFTFLDQFSKFTSTFKEGSGINLEKDGSFLKISSEEVDGSITNELQTLDYDGNTSLSITLGNQVDLSPLKDDPNAWKMNGNSSTSWNSPKLGFTVNNNKPLRIYTNNQERMRISEDGKVGIGTTNPQSDLHIEGNLVMNTFYPSDNGAHGTNSLGPNAGTGGYGNNFLGRDAGLNTTGNNNNFLGDFAGEMNTSGNNNNYFGSGAGSGNLTGSFNNFIGSSAGSTSTGSNNTFIGNGAGIKNHGDDNIIIGTHGENTDCPSGTTGDKNIVIGFQAEIISCDITNSIGIGTGVQLDASNQVVLGSYTIDQTQTPVTWTTTSDQRFKENISETVAGLDFIKLLRPVQYNFDMNSYASFLNIPKNQRDLNAENSKAAIKYTGFLAQEVETAANSLGFDFSGVDAPKSKDGHYGLRYSEFVVPLVKAVQEQQDIIDNLEERLERLENCACNPNGNIQVEPNTEIQNISDSDNFAVKVYPNPARQNLTLDIETGQEGLSEIKVFSNTGQLIAEESTLLLNGKNQFQLSCGEWGSGIYFITTTHLGVTVSRKVIVTK